MTVDHAAASTPEARELKYLVYTSVATRTMLPEDLESILFSSRRKNLDAEITGILLHRGNSFVQFIEGPPREVDSLMDRIARDDRHTGVRVLVVERAAERSFRDWTMGFAIPKGTRPTGIDEIRDSFTDLTSGGDHGVVRQAAQDFAIWFKAGQRARPS